MILMEMRRSMIQPLYYIYAVYEAARAISYETEELISGYGANNQYWVASDYEVVNGKFRLVNPMLVPTYAAAGYWTIDIGGNSVSSGTEIYKIESVGSPRTYKKYTNAAYGWKPGVFIRNERRKLVDRPVSGVQGGEWYELVGVPDEENTQWYWNYQSRDTFVAPADGIYRITCVGGGGGGGRGGASAESMSDGGQRNPNHGGGGGSGGSGVVSSKDVLMEKGASYSITIGSGGSSGRNGGVTSFGSILSAGGGTAGSNGTDATNYAGGTGGKGGSPNGNGGSSGGYQVGGTGGEKALISDSNIVWRYPAGIGGKGGNGFSENGAAGTSGIVVVEFRSL